MKCVCQQCGAGFERLPAYVNRSISIGAPLYCGRRCTGIARQTPKPTEAEAKAAKAEYDKQYRAQNPEKIKADKLAWYRANHADILARATVERPKKMPYHLEYCRQPAYRTKKSEYDLQLRARKQFGEFSEAFLLLRDVETEINQRASRYEIYSQNGTLNKALRRRRAL